MSLDDRYLREHLEQYKGQIKAIRWFGTETALHRHGDWADRVGIKRVVVNWPNFWCTVQREIGPQVRSAGVMTAWFYAIQAAITELCEGTPGQQIEPVLDRIRGHVTLREPGRSSVGQYRQTFAPGEGKQLLPAGFDKQKIDAEIRQAVVARANLVTQIQDIVRDYREGSDIWSALECAKPMRLRLRYMNVDTAGEA
jgi:hypothetical protein